MNDAEQAPAISGIILAGGLGTRLKGVAPDCPKPFVTCHGQPFIEWVMRHFQRQGVREFVVSLGHLADVAKRRLNEREPDDLRIMTVVESTPLGTGGAIRLAWDAHPAQQVIILNGDSLLLADFAPAWKIWSEAKPDALLIGVPQPDASRYGTLTFSDDGRLRSFEEKRLGSGVINAGIYLIRGELLATIPQGITLSIERDLFPRWLQEDRDIRVCVLSGAFLDIGLPETLAAADQFLEQHWQTESTS